ncbi:MAG: ABC transporter permease [Solirubrobacterales bacterium]
MRISDEIDAQVMGIQPVTFLAATRLLAAWMTIPFMYLAAVGIGILRLLPRRRRADRRHLQRRLPADLLDVARTRPISYSA